jgi:hypothetical protein
MQYMFGCVAAQNIQDACWVESPWYLPAFFLDADCGTQISFPGADSEGPKGCVCWGRGVGYLLPCIRSPCSSCTQPVHQAVPACGQTALPRLRRAPQGVPHLRWDHQRPSWCSCQQLRGGRGKANEGRRGGGGRVSRGGGGRLQYVV